MSVQKLPKLGVDGLGAAFFEKEFIKAALLGDVFGIMPETFQGKKKTSWKTVENLYKNKKFSEGVTHMTPFDRSHAYPIEKLKPLLKKNAQRLEAIARANPGTAVMGSPFCEHGHDRKSMKELFDWLRPFCPNVVFVNSIYGKGQTVPGICTEIHIESASNLPPVPEGEYIVSFDGFGGNARFPGDFPDADLSAIVQKYLTARHIRAWGARCNGKYSPTQPNPPEPNKRTYWPSAPYLKGYRLSLRIREGSVTYSDKTLLKTFADDHGAKEPTKDNRLMAIIPGGGDKAADIYDSKGKKIDSMARYQPDHTNDPKGRRYYSKKHAFQVADIAVKNTGSALITVKSGNVTLPPTDGYLRSGKFKGKVRARSRLIQRVAISSSEEEGSWI